MPFRTWLTGFVMTTMLSLGAADAAPDPENTLLLTLEDGVAVIELRPDLAPKHVARIKELTRKGFYDGLVFHRVIEGFMAQTGDPKGNGTGGSGVKLPAEFTKEPFVRGTVGMARSQDPNSGDSQFFICFAPARFLDGQYTVWGQVSKGMEFVDKIKRGDDHRNGEVSNPDRIVRMQVAGDIKQ
jgi:cyclophilin family peptidyl-prolyl cis-trans isomerase